MQPRRLGRTLSWWAVAAGLVCGAGCLSCFHPIDTPHKDMVAECHTVPRCCRDHVYVFLINGADPVNKDNLAGVRTYLHNLGFPKTYYGQVYHAFWFNSEIRRIHREEPDARFVLLGFSCGANVARCMAQALQGDGIQIDLLVYLGGDTLKNVPENQPENVCRILNIRSHGCVWFGCLLDGADLEQADNVFLDVSHSCLPSSPQTLQMLAGELMAIAGTVPHPAPPVEEQMPPALEEAPTPRPVVLKPATARDEWDFLKPVSQLRMPHSAEDSREAPAVERPGDKVVAK